MTKNCTEVEDIFRQFLGQFASFAGPFVVVAQVPAVVERRPRPPEQHKLNVVLETPRQEDRLAHERHVEFQWQY